MDGISNVNLNQSFSNQDSFNVSNFKEPDQSLTVDFENMLAGSSKPAACSLTDHTCGGGVNNSVEPTQELSFSLNNFTSDINKM